MGKKELQVAAIENGTVIDHIPTDRVLSVVDLLGLRTTKSMVTIGFNLKSQKMGQKSIIKIADRFFTQDEINRLSVVAPNIVLNIIRNYEVVEKKKVETPSSLLGIVICQNPKCITNNEPMPTYFHVVEKAQGIIRCHYCEKEQTMDNVKLVQQP